MQKKFFSALLRGLTPKHNGDFYCLNFLQSFRIKNKLELHKKVCENKDFCNAVMPSEDTKILDFDQHHKSNKTTCIIYAGLESLIEKINGRKNDQEKSSATKVNKHVPSGFSMPSILSFRHIENKHDAYKGKDYMKKFCESLREHAMKIINFNEVINKQTAGNMKMQRYVIFAIKSLKINMLKIKNIV